MTVTEQKKALTQKFERLSEHVAHGNPNDFSLQLPLTLESLDPEDQSMTCSFSIQERFGNPQGIAHGGIIATIMDIAQGARRGHLRRGEPAHDHRFSSDLLFESGSYRRKAVCPHQNHRNRQDYGFLHRGGLAEQGQPHHFGHLYLPYGQTHGIAVRPLNQKYPGVGYRQHALPAHAGPFYVYIQSVPRHPNRELLPPSA